MICLDDAKENNKNRERFIMDSERDDKGKYISGNEEKYENPCD
jgi:hypothetical protein